MVKKMAEAIKKATLEKAKMNYIVTAQEKQKQTYNRKHCTSSEIYSVGLRRISHRKREKGGSLIVLNWVGPYTITIES